jgi:hypothetical protein
MAKAKLVPKPDRRQPRADRRSVTRNGRRVNDPRQTPLPNPKREPVKTA